MKLYEKADIEALEQGAVEAGVSMESLMEQAGLALAVQLQNHFGNLQGKKVVLLCGKGNNGGDGFVCARHLHRLGAKPTVVLAQPQLSSSLARQAFEKMGPEVAVVEEESVALPLLKEADAVVDAIFGFSFSGALEGFPRRLLEEAAFCSGYKLAADLPSGIECDTGRADSATLRVHCTVTFTGKKPGCASYPGREYCGRVQVASVGVPLGAGEGKGLFEPDRALASACLPKAAEQSNKGSLGRLLCVVGSMGMAGAAIMACRAALRSGVGLVEAAVPEELYSLLAPALPEVLFTLLPKGREEEALLPALERATACVAGCGLGIMSAGRLLPLLLRHCTKPLLLDADALNALAKRPYWEREQNATLVLTPHPGEMSRLTGLSIAEIQANRLKTAEQFASLWGAVTVLKGAGTVIAEPQGRRAVNGTGNPGMAKGGSGDVLAGIIGSLLAQGIPPFEAATTGVYLHGMAGDRGAQKFTERALLPTDYIELLPEVFTEIY